MTRSTLPALVAGQFIISYIRQCKTAARSVCLFIFLFLVSCSYYPLNDTEPVGQVLGDFSKCSDPENQSLPECYCHALAIERHPERQESCQPMVSTNSNEPEDAYLAGSCSNPAVSLNSLGSLAERKKAFCNLPDNWDRSSCYCYSGVVNKNPDRKKFCRSVEQGHLRHDLAPHGFRSVNWVQALREHTYWTEQTVDELTEIWSDNSDAYLNHLPVKDDCDAVDSLLGLAFALGGFEMFELAKVLVDTNLEDDIIADHYVGAIWVSGDWYYIEAGSDEVRLLGELAGEDIFYSNLDYSPSSRIVAHRKLDQSEWYQGQPPSLNALTSYCPVPAELLFSSLG